MKKGSALMIGIIALIIIAIIAGGVMWVLLNNPEEKQDEDTGSQINEEDTSSLMVELLEKAEDIESYKYRSEIESDGIKVETLVWIKGNKMRTETEAGGLKTISIIDADGKSYTYLPDTNVALESDSPETKDIEDIPNYNPEPIGMDRIDKKDCLWIEYTREGRNIEICLWEKNGIAIQTEVTYDSKKVTSTKKDLEIIDIPDSMFELPEGVQITEIPT